jgi:hypothetical protein
MTQPHPVYGDPIEGKITLTNGIVFRPYKAGPHLQVRCSDDHRITLVPQPAGWLAFVDGWPVIEKKKQERLRFITREEAERVTARLAKEAKRQNV